MCPKCGGEKQRVIEVKRGDKVDQRQVVCLACNHVFKTETHIVEPIQQKEKFSYRPRA